MSGDGTPKLTLNVRSRRELPVELSPSNGRIVPTAAETTLIFTEKLVAEASRDTGGCNLRLSGYPCSLAGLRAAGVDVICDVMYVLDTNILVAALWSRTGASFRILEAALSGTLPYAVSVALALEYDAVLNRSSMREASWATKVDLDVLLDAFIGQARHVMPIRTKLRPTLADPADDMVLECAVQSGADAIVTMNVRDFAPARRLYRVDVIKPGELYVRIDRGDFQ